MTHDLPVMIRMDTKLLMPTVPWIHLSADKGFIHLTRSIFMTVSRKHPIKASNLENLFKSRFPLGNGANGHDILYCIRVAMHISPDNTMYSTILLTIG